MEFNSAFPIFRPLHNVFQPCELWTTNHDESTTWTAVWSRIWSNMLIMGSRATANQLVFELPCGTAYLPFNWQAPFKSTSFPYFVASGHFAQLDYLQLSLVIMHGRLIRILWSRKVNVMRCIATYTFVQLNLLSRFNGVCV